MPTTQDTIHEAKAHFLRVKERVTHLLATTPDNRIHWSPSPTARTPVQQVAHVAAAIRNIHAMLDGRPFGVKNVVDADKGFRGWERQFNTREQVLDLLEQHSAAYVAWLDALTPE